MSKFCKYCGAELPDEASFCPVCAADQVVKAEVEIPKPRKKRIFAAIIAGAAVVIAAAGLWAVFNTVPESPEPAVSEAVVKEVEASPEPTAEEVPEPSPAETVPEPSPVEESEQLPSPEPSPIAEVVPSPTPVAEEPEEAPGGNDSAASAAETGNSLWYTVGPGERREFSGSATVNKGDTWYFKFYYGQTGTAPLSGTLASSDPGVISLNQNDYGDWDAVMESAGTSTLTFISDNDGKTFTMDVTVVDQKLPFDPGPPAVAPPESQIQSGSTYNLTFEQFTVPVGGNFGTGAQGPHRIGVYKDGVRITDFSYTFEDPEACELYIDSEGYLMLTNVLGGEYQLTITVGSDVLNFMWVGGPRKDAGN